MKFRIQFDDSYKESPHKEVNNLPSETIPDKSYTIQELLYKFTQGVLPDVSVNENYDENYDDDVLFDQVESDVYNGNFDLSDIDGERNHLNGISRNEGVLNKQGASVAKADADSIAPHSTQCHSDDDTLSINRS